DEVVDFSVGQLDLTPNQRVQQARRDHWPKPMCEIVRHASLDWIVPLAFFVNVQVEADGVFQLDEGPVVEERGRQRQITKRCRAELVAVLLRTRDLRQTE